MHHRLLFDVTELTQFDKGTGIQRVTRALLQALGQASPAGWQVVAVRGDGRVGSYFPVNSSGQPCCEVHPHSSNEAAIEPAAGDIFLSVDLAYNMNQSLREELIRFRSCGVGVYFVIHDLIPLMHPEWFTGESAWFEGNDYLKLFNYWFECASEESDGLICISAAVRNEVEAWLTMHPPNRSVLPKLGYFHLGSDIAGSRPSSGMPRDAADVLSHMKSSPTFLMVGTLEPRKGHGIALDAIEGLWAENEDVTLAFVGKQGWGIESLIDRIRSHPRFGTRLFWLDGISDEYLCQVYMASSAMLALSLAEGFGLPLAEAAYYRLPLIVRNIPVFREICEEAATYFNDTSSEALQRLLHRWLADKEAGRCIYPDRMRVLSWRDSAAQLMSVLGHMRGDESFWSRER